MMPVLLVLDGSDSEGRPAEICACASCGREYAMDDLPDACSDDCPGHSTCPSCGDDPAERGACLDAWHLTEEEQEGCYHCVNLGEAEDAVRQAAERHVRIQGSMPRPGARR